MDISPKGDPPGFVSVLDDTTLAIPDRPGNKRFDTFTNLIENPRVAIIFLVPRREETLRVGGTATIVTDPDLLATMAVGGRQPKLALLVDVEEAMFHCGKSMIRSRLWQPEDWGTVDGLASYAECLADQAASDETVEEMEIRFGAWHHGRELY
jgi:PPOX class probable FMN-dependent enzyme